MALPPQGGTARSPPAVGVPAREYVTSWGGSEDLRVGLARTLAWMAWVGAAFTGPLSRTPASSELNRARASTEALKGSGANPSQMMSEYTH